MMTFVLRAARYGVLLAWCWLAAMVVAQAQTQQDVVYLKNGSVLRGTVVEYSASGSIKVRIAGGTELVYAASEVERIVKEDVAATANDGGPTLRPMEAQSEPFLLEKGFYVTTQLGFLPGRSLNDGPALGLTVDGTAGYQINYRFGVGFGAGIHVYGPYTATAVYGETRCYLRKSSSSPYVGGQLGYGNTVRTAAMDNVKGGVFARPFVGMRFESPLQIQAMLEMGFQLQRTTFDVRDWWDPTGSDPVSRYDVLYRRLSVRMVLLL